MTTGSSRRSVQALGKLLCSLESIGVNHGVQKLVDMGCRNTHNGFFTGDKSLAYHVYGTFYCRLTSSLSATSLQNVQLALLHGEFHVLHVTIVLFKALTNGNELSVNFCIFCFQLADFFGSTDTSNNVFSLGVHQVFTVELVFSSGRIAAKANTSSRIHSKVTKYHGLDVYGCSCQALDIVHGSVFNGSIIHPRAENCIDGAPQLLNGVLGEFFSNGVLVNNFVGSNKLFQVGGGKVGVQGNTTLCLQFGDSIFKVVCRNTHGNVTVHLDKAAVSVPSKTWVSSASSKTLCCLVVHSQVQDGVHHSGHGNGSTRTNGYQQRIISITQLLAHKVFQSLQVCSNLFLQSCRIGFVVFVEKFTDLCGNGESGGNRNSKTCHLCQVGSLASQLHFHGCVSVSLAGSKEIYKFLVCH